MAEDDYLTQIPTSLHHYICRRISNAADVEDVEQDILFEIWKSRNNFQHRSSFYTWTRRIADNRIVDFYRRRYLKQEKELTAGMAWIEQKKREGIAENIIPRVYVNQLLDKESARVRDIAERRSQGENFYEIAAALGGTYEGVRSAWRRAVKRIEKRAAADQP